MDIPPYDGARRPDRRRDVDVGGLRLAVYEWGPPDGPPILLAHGGFDFAATFDLYAPLVADAGWRVVSWDQRGHGDSDHAALYSWDADVRDALAVWRSTSDGPVVLAGHSKGGSLMLQLAEACPHVARAVVNLDGIPFRYRPPDIPDHERTRMLAGELEQWLAHRRTIGTARRRPGTLEDLARRRAKMNPRLPEAWLVRLAAIGARRDADGWRWKIDPALRFGGFGPWRSEWSMMRLAAIGVPLLGILATVEEPMGWGQRPDDLEDWLPPDAELIDLPDTGHFVHVERPTEVAALTVGFLERLGGMRP